MVQYWRSSDHLAKYAASSTNKHYSPWLFLLKLGRETDELSFGSGFFLILPAFRL
jgi:hypothetical protein